MTLLLAALLSFQDKTVISVDYSDVPDVK